MAESKRSEADASSETSSSDREMVVTRLLPAPRELVFAAFTDAKHISAWWGPNGFTTTTYEKDVRPGGQWLFTMHGPDGTDYPNRIRYTEVRPLEFLAYDHDEGEGGNPLQAFKATVTIEPEGRNTRVTLRLTLATPEQRKMLAEFGAIEGGNQTLARLEDYLSRAGKTGMTKSNEQEKIEPFVISRVFDAPRELVFKAFTEPERMKEWWGPKGFKGIAGEMDLRPGGRYHYGLQAPDGSIMWGLFVYREVSAPERIVLVNSFSDAEGGLTRHPMNPKWPLRMLSIFTFEDVGSGKTKLTVSWTPIEESAEEREVFEQARPSMTQGWSGTFGQLESYLGALQKGE
ncbi:SRPBCC family protein [Hyphomicrobium sp.]|uniref:SRPBCC family protein n=1 Tax=Hyphomicrobium sp. TaxID=82 RepID=UPI0025B9ED8E|nr:SRPBCC family protein [Hyphomicrobium sp.]